MKYLALIDLSDIDLLLLSITVEVKIGHALTLIHRGPYLAIDDLHQDASLAESGRIWTHSGDWGCTFT
jgi:hypothetical protein